MKERVADFYIEQLVDCTGKEMFEEYSADWNEADWRMEADDMLEMLNEEEQMIDEIANEDED